MLVAAMMALQFQAAPPPPKDFDAEITKLIQEWVGDYETVPGDPDLHAGIVRPIAVPHLGKRAVFVEFRKGGPKGKIIFQRIFVFQDMPGRTRNWVGAYYFGEPQLRARLDQRPAEAAALTPADLKKFDFDPGTCGASIFPERGGYILTVHKESCRIVSNIKERIVMHPEFRLTVGNGQFSFFEQGFFENGVSAFGPITYTVNKIK